MYRMILLIIRWAILKRNYLFISICFVFTIEKKSQLINAKQPDDFIKYMGRTKYFTSALTECCVRVPSHRIPKQTVHPVLQVKILSLAVAQRAGNIV